MARIDKPSLFDYKDDSHRQIESSFDVGERKK